MLAGVEPQLNEPRNIHRNFLKQKTFTQGSLKGSLTGSLKGSLKFSDQNNSLNVVAFNTGVVWHPLNMPGPLKRWGRVERPLRGALQSCSFDLTIFE